MASERQLARELVDLAATNRTVRKHLNSLESRSADVEDVLIELAVDLAAENAYLLLSGGQVYGLCASQSDRPITSL